MTREHQAFVNDLQAELLTTDEFKTHKFRILDHMDIIPESDIMSGEARVYFECGDNKDIKQVCSVKIGDLFAYYEDGCDIRTIAEKILNHLNMIYDMGIEKMASEITDYSRISSRLFVRLLNYDNNRKALEQAVYRRVGDVAEVLYIKAGENEGVLTSTKVRKDFLRIWNMDENQVFDKARSNTLVNNPPRLYDWRKLLFDCGYEGDEFMGESGSNVLTREPAGNCITTKNKTNGAVAAFLPGVLERVSELLESDLYIAFTSIHEVMVHSAEQAEPSMLKDVLGSTIDECTQENDILSRNIFFFDKGKKELTCLDIPA
ncbi:MAG: hypothetical protein IJ123_02485 [Blautia sp.]|nr:hypothetical protein [Blautia sp.]